MNDPYVARSTRLGTCTLAGEAIIVTPSDSRLYSLNDVATVIWEAADGKTRLSEIVEQRICQGYDIDRETAMADALAFVADFSAKGLFATAEVPFDSCAVGAPFLENQNG